MCANYKGFYNVYNILAAYAGERGLPAFQAEHFTGYAEKVQSGKRPYGAVPYSEDCSVTLNLAKNPAGFNQNISAVMQDTAPKDVIITINDNAQDGRDISWLWDVDFDQ